MKFNITVESDVESDSGSRIYHLRIKYNDFNNWLSVGRWTERDLGRLSNSIQNALSQETPIGASLHSDGMTLVPAQHCELCGEISDDGGPHKDCTDREQMIADRANEGFANTPKEVNDIMAKLHPVIKALVVNELAKTKKAEPE